MGRPSPVVRFALCLNLLLLLSFSSACLAAEEKTQPISVEADRMVSQENKNSVMFIGKVDARQGTLIIRADEMTVFYTEKKDGEKKDGKPAAVAKPAAQEGPANPASNQVEKLICVRNVKISQGDWLGTGDRMEYFAKERKAVLMGNAKAWQGQNMVSGKTIVYYLDEKRSVVEPDATTNGRVKAVIHPEAKK